MKVLVTCGHPYSGLELAYDALTQAGLERPQLSSRESLSPTDVHEKIFKANDLDLSGLNIKAPLDPGKIWQVLAVDLFMGNIDQTSWGWVDARSTWLLDFWKELDPQIRFVLIYSTPEFAVGKMLQDKGASPPDIGLLITSWQAYHSEMLRFYNRNPDRSLLVNISTVMHSAKPFIEKSNNAFGINLKIAPSLEKSDHRGVSAIAAMLAKMQIENQEEAHALYRELESTADIADNGALSANTEKAQALAEYSKLLAQNECSKLKQEYAQLEKKNELLLNQLHQVREELTNASPKHKQEYAELEKKNELLLNQLHQVQGLLKKYYLDKGKPSAIVRQVSVGDSFVNKFWAKHQPSEIIIDFKGEIDGNNWYYAESDGRWAGPNPSSTVKLPSLRSGRYELYLDVVDAMAPEIVKGMEISLNGSGLEITVNGKGYPVIVYSKFTVEDTSEHSIWEFQFKFPQLISPAQHGSTDKRNLAIRVRSLKLRVAA